MKNLTDEKCREQFEEWLDKNSFNKNRDEMGAYEASFCQIAWIGWKASREALEEQGEGEWIEWGGKGSPVKDPMVEVKFRNGEVDKDIASHWVWFHEGAEDDIIAYRIIPERSRNQKGE